MSLIRKRNLKIWTVPVLLALVLAAAALFTRTTRATPSSGVSAEPITSGRLTEPVGAKFKEVHAGFGDGTGVSNVVMAKFTVEPGGEFGWHQHDGPVWVVIASGALTFYDADDASCAGEVLGAGSAVLDPGDGTHTARNEGDEPVVLYGTFMLPEGGEPRLDVSAPSACDF